MLSVASTNVQGKVGMLGTDTFWLFLADKEPRASLFGQPRIALFKEKHLVVAYKKGIAVKGDMGSIDAIVSSNDGDSWSIPSTIFDHEQRHGALQFAYCNAVLYRPPGQGVLWCFSMRCPLDFTDSEDSHLAAACSGDGGRSWNPVELAMHYTGPLVILGIPTVDEERERAMSRQRQQLMR